MIFAMEPRVLAHRMALSAKMAAVDLREAAKQTRASAPAYVIEGGVARIPVQGALADYRSLFYEIFGGGPVMTYSEMADAILTAADDPDVKKIQLDVDSPGGEVNGLAKTVEAVQLARTVKPVHAVVGSMAASAAYWIASQAETITADGELTQVGSIGVAAAVYQPDGVYQIASTAAPRKRPDVSTEEGQAVIRDELDDIHAIFARQVAEGRGVDVEKVNADFGQGGIVLAAEAKKRGMIDKVRKPAGVAGEKPAGAKDKKGVRNMTIEQIKAEAPDAAAALRDEGIQAGIQAERKRVAELSAWRGINADADKAVEEAVASGKSYSEVAAQLAAAVAKGNSKQADGENAATVQTATASNGAGVVDGMDDEDREAAKIFGMTAEEYRKFSKEGK